MGERGPSSDPGEMEVSVPARGWVELTAPSREKHLDRISALLDELAEAGIGPQAREEVRLAVTEIVSNAIEWGNKADSGKKIRVCYGLFDDELVLKVEDEGEGFDPAGVPDPTKDPLGVLFERKLAGKRIGGFGLHMARKLMDRVEFNRRGNVALLVKHLS